MYVQPIRPEQSVPFVPVELREVEPHVAVLLNANAKRVDDKVIRALSHVVPDGDLFVSRTYEDARAIAQQVVDRKYRVVITGGGDGTFMGFANEIFNLLERRQSASPFGMRAPRFGVLKLGTGSLLANLTGASSLCCDGILDDVLRARANEIPGVKKLELISTEGKRAPFAGIGLDAGILNHYVENKRAAGTGTLGKLYAGGAGYFLTITGTSAPYYALNRKRPEMEIRTRGVAYRMGPDGKPVGEPIAPGSLLYTGPAVIAAAGTVPCYGFNFRIFPFAGTRRGFMHLRVANVPLPSVVANLPRLWNGKWFTEGLHDFLVEDVELKLDQKVPYQIGGDAEGYRDALRWSMWNNSVELLDYSTVRR
ncbi:MAG: diacylglycerol/lipid kinase family protein [Myxococcales bacterium]